MDKRDKKRTHQQWRTNQRAEARSKLPLQPNDLRALFARLDRELPRLGCDHTRRITIAWLESQGHPVESVCTWLDENGGFCDCEVLNNSEQNFEEAMRGSDF